MPVVAGRSYVRAPAYTANRFGLFSAADLADDGAVRWRGGVDTSPVPCDEAGSTLDGCPANDTPTKTATSASSLVITGAEPFTVYAYTPCSPVGIGDTQIQARTVDALRNGEGRAAERVFWTGTPSLGGAVRPHLAANAAVTETTSGGVVTTLQTAATVVSGSVMPTEQGLAVLEGALAACYGGEGVIHVPATLGSYLASRGAIFRDGSVMRTGIGNKVAIYASNNREGPTGSAPAAGNYWMYATGNVNIHRSQIEEASGPLQAVNRGDNTFVYIAERTYVIHWDCCLLAQQVTLS